jgi:hypothetical protein
MADGVIVRTHPMRGTWHFVAAEDIRWLLSVTAPRSIANSAYYYRQLELDDATFARSNAVLAKTLRGGKQLTRKELAAALAREGLSVAGLRLTFLVMRAELDGVIASGARRGKQFTYALLDELAPACKALERDEALAELARRYFMSHGPATIQDFAWWAELTVADARAGLEMVKSQFVQEVIDGQTYWLSPSTPTLKVASPAVHLLPPYDEYTVAYKDRGAVLDPAFAGRTSHGLGPVILVNGHIAGTWKRTIKKDEVMLTPDLFLELNGSESVALATSVSRYAAFLGSEVRVTVE